MIRYTTWPDAISPRGSACLALASQLAQSRVVCAFADLVRLILPLWPQRGLNEVLGTRNEGKGGRSLQPACGSRTCRRLADAPCGGRGVVIELSARRLFRDNDACPRVTFAEQIDGLTWRYGRRTPVLQRLLASLGIVLAARAVARLALLFGIVISRMTVLRLVMALPDPAWATPRVLGIDEFATGKGRRYGTILVDCESHQPLDLLPDRDADSVASGG